jgi:hypothetical protein
MNTKKKKTASSQRLRKPLPQLGVKKSTPSNTKPPTLGSHTSNDNNKDKSKRKGKRKRHANGNDKTNDKDKSKIIDKDRGNDTVNDKDRGKIIDKDGGNDKDRGKTNDKGRGNDTVKDKDKQTSAQKGKRKLSNAPMNVVQRAKKKQRTRADKINKATEHVEKQRLPVCDGTFQEASMSLANALQANAEDYRDIRTRFQHFSDAFAQLITDSIAVAGRYKDTTRTTNELPDLEERIRQLTRAITATANQLVQMRELLDTQQQTISSALALARRADDQNLSHQQAVDTLRERFNAQMYQLTAITTTRAFGSPSLYAIKNGGDSLIPHVLR